MGWTRGEDDAECNCKGASLEGTTVEDTQDSTVYEQVLRRDNGLGSAASEGK